jgi:hypothetical protein
MKKYITHAYKALRDHHNLNLKPVFVREESDLYCLIELIEKEDQHYVNVEGYMDSTHFYEIATSNKEEAEINFMNLMMEPVICVDVLVRFGFEKKEKQNVT